MDPNLYFRFIVPAWTGAIAALFVGWMGGGRWVSHVAGGDSDRALLVAATVVLASPALGFLLNTLVVTACNAFGIGPEYALPFRRMCDRLKSLSPAQLGDRASNIAHTVERMRTAAVVAHFEYRTDPPPLLEWRRRQRAAFFADWATVLAIVYGILIGLVLNGVPWWACTLLAVTMLALATLTYALRRIRSRHDFATSDEGTLQRGLWVVWMLIAVDVAVAFGLVSFLMCWRQASPVVVASALVWFLAYLAGRSESMAEEQQMIWVESWTDSDLAEYLKTCGTGFRPIQKNDGGHGTSPDVGS